jgi:hypothetical protein
MIQLREKGKTILQVFVTGVIFLLSSSFFAIVAFPHYFTKLPNFGQRTYGIGILVVVLLTVTGGVCIRYSTYPQRAITWLRVIIPIVFSYAYFLRVTAASFNFFGIVLSTHITCIPLVLLITGCTWFIISQKHIPFGFLVGQIVVLAMQTYSLLGFLDFDRTDKRLFAQDWLSQVFSLNSNIWLLLTSFGVAIVTIMSFDILHTRKNIVYCIIFGSLIFQGLFMIHALDNQFYTYQTLLFLILWDFLYYPFKVIVTGYKDDQYTPRLIWSCTYHLVLFTLVVNIQNLIM